MSKHKFSRYMIVGLSRVALLALLNVLTFAQSSPDFIQSLDWKPDGSLLAVGHSIGSDTVVELLYPDGTMFKQFTFSNVGLFEVAWRPPDGAELAILTTDVLHILEPESEAVRTIEFYQMETISWSPDGTLFAGDGAGDSEPVYITDAVTFDDVQTLPGNFRDSVGPVAWHPLDNDIAAAGTFEGWLRVWRVSTGEEIHSQRDILGSGVVEIAWSPNADKIALGFGGIIEVWSTEDWTLFATGAQIGTVRDLAWNNDGTLLASVGENGVWITDPITGDNVSRIDVGSSPGAVAWSPDGSTLAYGNVDNPVQIVPAPQTTTIPTADSANTLAESGDTTPERCP